MTRTLLPGLTPSGTQTISVSSENNAATGAATIAELLPNLPQDTGMFNGEPPADCPI